MIFNTIAELIAEHIECDPSEIKMETTFESLGIDSLDELDLDRKVATVGELVAFAEEKNPNK